LEKGLDVNINSLPLEENNRADVGYLSLGVGNVGGKMQLSVENSGLVGS
jgi:hypothetical protein